MHNRLMAVLCLVALLAGCEGLNVESSGPKMPNTCVVKADEPHLSSTATRKGYRSMVAKAWFICSTSLTDATLDLEAQERRGGGWTFVEGAPALNVDAVKVKKKYQSVVEIDCATGTFRARARLAGHGADGVAGRSPWVVSRARTDPCGKG